MIGSALASCNSGTDSDKPEESSAVTFDGETHEAGKPDGDDNSCTHDYKSEVIPPSCTEGYTLHTCALCDHSYTDTYTAAAGHKFTEKYIDSDCNKYGTHRYTCSVCGYSEDKVSDVAGTLHKMTKIKTVPPTRTEGGYTLYRCSLCSHEEQRNPTSPTSYSTGLKYEKIDYVYYVTGIGSCSDTDIVIPSKNEHGQEVKGIYYEAFKNQTQITSVTIPSTVVDIRNSAFVGCSGITKLDVPRYCDAYAGAFYGMDNLKELSMPLYKDFGDYFRDGTRTDYPPKLDTLHIKTITGSSFTLSSCTQLKKVTFDNSITNIPDFFMGGCTSLSDITLPTGLTALGHNAFQGTAISEFTLPRTITIVPYELLYGCTSLTNVNLHDGVITIENGVFNGCSSLTELTLPPKLQHLNFRALAGTSITEITVPASMTVIDYGAFSGAKLLSKINLHSGITNIGAEAFVETALESFTLPESVNTVGGALFRNCTSLTSVTLNSKISSIGGDFFNGCSALKTYTVPSTVTTLGSQIFKDCTSLESVIFHDSITSIGENIFSGCTAIEEIALPALITAVPNGTFADCTSLARVTFAPDTVSIGSSAFKGCTSLASVTLPATLCEIQSSAFNGSGLVSIDISASNPKVSSSAFANCLSLKSAVVGSGELKNSLFYRCAALETVTVNEGALTITENMFAECTSLKTVNLPDSIKSIEYAAFRGCTALEEITLPKGLTSANYSAFSNCNNIKTLNFNCESLKSTSSPINFSDITTLNIGAGVKSIPAGLCHGAAALTSVSFPETLTTIGEKAFLNCTSLATVNFPASLTDIGAYSFSGCALISAVFEGSAELVIGSSAFYSCPELTHVDFSNRVTLTTGDTFYYCQKLTTVEGTENIYVNSKRDFPEELYTKQGALVIFGATLVGYDEELIDSVVTVPEGIKYIAASAFADCAVVRDIYLPSSLIYIGESAFKNCTRLSKVVFGTDGTSLELAPSVFEGCTALKEIEFPSYVTEIPSRVLYGCTAIERVGFGAGVTSIAEDFCNQSASADAIRLRTLYNISYGGTKAQWQALVPAGNKLLSACTVTCSDGDITSILYYCNNSYTGLYYTVDTNLTMTVYSSAVPTDKGSYFSGSNLYDRIRKLVISEGVTSFDTSIFYANQVMTDVVIPSTLESISLTGFVNTPWYQATQVNS